MAEFFLFLIITPKKWQVFLFLHITPKKRHDFFSNLWILSHSIAQTWTTYCKFTQKNSNFTPKKWQIFFISRFTQKKWQVFFIFFSFILLIDCFFRNFLRIFFSQVLGNIEKTGRNEIIYQKIKFYSKNAARCFILIIS